MGVAIRMWGRDIVLISIWVALMIDLSLDEELKIEYSRFHVLLRRHACDSRQIFYVYFR